MLCNNPAVNCDCVLLSLVNKKLTEQYQEEFIGGTGRHGGNKDEGGQSQGRYQPVAEEAGCIQNEVTSHEQHGRAQIRKVG